MTSAASADDGLASIKLIGSSGKFGTSCAGFLFSQIDRAITSFVMFDTTSTTLAARTATRITPLSAGETGSQNLVFTISVIDDSTKLKTLKYANGDAPVVTAMPGLTSSAVGAIVTFSANDGGVTTILPYTGTRGGAPISTERKGNVVTLHGKFLGLWDRSGANRKPAGTSDVSIDLSTGELVSSD